MNLVLGQKQWPLVMLFIAVGWLLYAKTLDVPFYFDDARNIGESISVRMTDISSHNLWQSWSEGTIRTRPLTNTSFALNYYFHQYRVGGYHVVNISIHILTGIFLYLLFSAILQSPTLGGHYRLSGGWLALAAAMIWFVNPVHIQTVTYIVQRMNGMGAMFYVLSLWLYLRGRQAPAGSTTWTWLTGAGLAGLCALGSKEIAATLPVMVFLCEWYFVQNLSRAWLKRALPFLLSLTGVFLFIVFIYLGTDPLAAIQNAYRHREFTLGERLLTEMRVVVFYLGLFFYPSPGRLNLDHDFTLSSSLLEPISTLLAGLFIIFLIATAVLGARRTPLLSFALAWFLVNLLIESTVIGLEIIFEHRTYLPSMFLTLPLVALAHQVIKSVWCRLGALVLLLLLGAFWTIERNEVWRDPVALWSDSVNKSPIKARPHNNLSVVLWEKGQLDRAEFEAKEAIRLKPDYIKAFVSLGNIYKDKGLLTMATQEYMHALRLKPDYADMYVSLANIMIAQGKLDAAVELLGKALMLQPKNFRAKVNLASVYAMQGKLDQAIANFETALELSPENADILYNLGVAYADMGRYEKALKTLRMVTSLNPADRDASLKIIDLEKRLRREQ